jgi:myo-inositol-1-phosphate synthase
VFGGCDILPGTVVDAAEAVYRRSRTYPRELLDAVSASLADIDGNIVSIPELAWRVNEPQRDLPSLQALVTRVRERLRGFAADQGLAHVVLVNLISAEALPADDPGHQTVAGFEALLAADRKDRVSPSMVYAYAAFAEGCSQVNFSPCVAASIPALRAMAEQRGLPHCGNVGKTGETLVKTALAPMFAARHLTVMSWEGVNMLGNADGRALAEPERRQAKLANKEQVLEKILGYPLHAGVGIEYVPSLGDWKTAWDLIHFKGFLDVPMTMQFTWQGADSILAAPLVLDLARFCEFAARHGERGLMPQLACFFKNPMGCDEQDFFLQYDRLLRYCDEHLR